MTRSVRVDLAIVLVLLGVAASGCCTCKHRDDGPGKGHGEGHSGKDRDRAGRTYEFTSGFVQDPRGRWLPSPMPGSILAVSGSPLSEGVAFPKAAAEPPNQFQAQAHTQAHTQAQNQAQAQALSYTELVSYALFEGVSDNCSFGDGDTGSYRYVAGRHWPRQRKHWTDATCDATTIIMQEVIHPDGSRTDRVFLLWDGRPPTAPRSQVTVELVNGPGVTRILTCSTAAQECYVETHDGLTFSERRLVQGSGHEAFVDCVRAQAASSHLTEAVQWLIPQKQQRQDGDR